MNDQSHLVFTVDGKSMVDYIGRTEHINDDWVEVVEHISERSGLHTTVREVPVLNPTVAIPAVVGKYVGCIGQTVRHLDVDSVRVLALMYARDVFLFDFRTYTPTPALETE